MSRENKSRYALLGMLSFQPRSGYDLKKDIEQSTNFFWNEDFAQIYPMLRQFEAEGLATKQAEKHAGRPERYVYTLTEKGWETLSQWLMEPAVPQVERNELLLKIFFGRQTTLPITLEHLQRHRAMQEQLLVAYEQIEEMLAQEQKESPDLPYWLITLSYGKRIAQALLGWCDESLARLESLADKAE